MVCDKLDLPPNVEVLTNTCGKEGASSCDCVISFKCRGECYELTGPTELRCKNGKWDKEPPTCPIKECTVPEPSMSHWYIYDHGIPGSCHFEAQIDGEMVNPGDKIECGKVLEVHAEASDCWHVCHNKNLTCTADGTWDVEESEIPGCVEMTCDDPPNFDDKEHNALLVDVIKDDKVQHKDDDDYTCKSIARYRCKDCHRLKSGSLELACKAKDIVESEKGTWVGEPPVCELMECSVGDLIQVLNATIHKSDNIKEELTATSSEHCPAAVKYVCDECSILNGLSEAKCTQKDLTEITSWKPDAAPSCDPVCCDEPIEIMSNHADYNVTATKYTYLHGAHVNTSCPNNGLDYVCQEIRADCDICFEFKGPGKEPSSSAPTRRCEKDPSGEHGYWSNVEKKCTRKECIPRTIDSDIYHAHYEVSENINVHLCNQSVNIHCDQCYSINEDTVSETHTCTSDKTWDLDLPMCKKVSCEVAPEIENGEVTQSGVISGSSCDVASYTCGPCYRLVGESELTCTRDANSGKTSWSAEPPRCEPVCCEELTDNIDPTLHKLTEEKSFVKEKKIHQFSKEEMSVKDNFDTCSENYVCQSVETKCKKCFEYTGDDGIVGEDRKMNPPLKECVKSNHSAAGEWKNKDKHCTLKMCDFREITEEMNMKYSFPTDYVITKEAYCGMEIETECNDCFELPGGATTHTYTCQDTKLWDHPLPTCERSQCQDPPEVEHCSYNPGPMSVTERGI
eukprot:sb/3479560/